MVSILFSQNGRQLLQTISAPLRGDNMPLLPDNMGLFYDKGMLLYEGDALSCVDATIATMRPLIS